MSEHGRAEVRLITAASLTVAGMGVASSVSPAIEAGLNLWVGIPLAVLGVVSLAVVSARAVWGWLLVEWEIRRPLQPDELAQRETEGV
jgi:hypothetical protein